MARMPDADLATAEDAKLVGYLLDANHPSGGPKARFLMAFGFSPDEPERLR